jgi:cell division protein FtsQ
MAKRTRITVKSVGGRTTRHEAQAQFNRKKAKHRLRQIKRRGLLIAAVATVVVMGSGGWWMHHTGTLQRSTAAIANDFWNATAHGGFAVQQVYVKGRVHANVAVVKAALDIKPGAPILRLSLNEIQARLQAIPEVKTATISRQLPHAISVVLTERKPVALWQRDEKHLLVDSDGIVLAKGNYPNVKTLPIIVGDDAPKHVREFTALLDSQPDLRHEVVAAVRVGDRRWNVQLKRDITVMLPEAAPMEAWKRFAGLVQKDALFSKAIRSVDMRIEDRVFIMPAEQQKNMVTLTNAKDI